jgi:hypothetical protein
MRKSIPVYISLLLLLFVSLAGIPGCGGGGGGGSAVYSVAGGIWQMTSTDTATGIVGARIAFRSNGTGYIDIYGFRTSITWSQNGNTLVIAIPGAGADAVSLDWNGPNEFTWTNGNGGHATYVRVGNVSSVVEGANNSGGGSGRAARDAGLIGR